MTDEKIREIAKKACNDYFDAKHRTTGIFLECVMAAIREALQAQWVRVAPETMPPEGKEVEAVNARRGFRRFARWYPDTQDEDGAWTWDRNRRFSVNANLFTHWRDILPLPAPPEDRDEK